MSALYGVTMGRLTDTHALVRRLEEQMRKFDQDRRNARMIGEMVVRQLGVRLRRAEPTASPSIPDPGPVVASAGTALSRNTHAEVDRWALLGATELITRIDELSIAELDALQQAEEQGRNRAAVLDAIARRRGHVDT